MTPEELFDEFIPAYLHVLITDALLTGHAGELINTSLEEFVKPWCEKIQSMIDAAQAEQRRKDIEICQELGRPSNGDSPYYRGARHCAASIEAQEE